MKPVTYSSGEPWLALDEAYLCLAKYFHEPIISRSWDRQSQHDYEQNLLGEFHKHASTAKSLGGLPDQAVYSLLCKAEDAIKAIKAGSFALSPRAVVQMTRIIRTVASATPCQSKGQLKSRFMAETEASRTKAMDGPTATATGIQRLSL